MLFRITRILLKKASRKFFEDDPIKLAATLSFIALFAIAPIIVMVLALLGSIVDQHILNEKMFFILNDTVGDKITGLLREIIINYSFSWEDMPKTILSVFIFIIATTTFFNIIQNALNFIWRVKPKQHFFLRTLQDRLKNIFIILGLSFIFLFILIIEASSALLKEYLNETLPDLTYLILTIIKFLFSFVLFTITFAAMYKLLPAVKIRWKIVWMGSIFTATLFSAGRYLISYGLNHVQIASIYGAAGSMVVFLLWVFYSSLIFFYGAELTYQYASIIEKKITPKRYAVKFDIIEHEFEPATIKND